MKFFDQIVPAARLAVLFLCLAACHGAVAWGDQNPSLDALIAAGDLEQAADRARTLDESGDPTVDLTLSFARLGRAFQKAGDVETATEFYSRAVVASKQPAAASLGQSKLILVRLAAASTMSQTGKLVESIGAIESVLDPSVSVEASQQRTAVAIALQVGASALGSGDTSTAKRAYAIARASALPEQKPTAMLGDAWVSAVAGSDPTEAARKLAAFVSAYPEHADASGASRACAECLRQAGRDEDATNMIADLLVRWPDSESAVDIVRGHAGLALDLVPVAVREWILKKAVAGDLDLFDGPATIMGMLVATAAGDAKAWSNLAQHLATIDVSGQSTSDLLSQLSRQGRDGEAERFAAALISPQAGDRISAGAREAACRWAGRTEHWSMLAMASETELENLSGGGASRTVTVERLLAESLMQVGRVADAKIWWDHLVQNRGVTDFATLLRCAEAETSTGDDTSLAGQRISMARAAAGEDAFKVTLVDMLAAELSIRRTQFDDARSLLENVVRAGNTDASLRGRAQWLIGETFYLQQNFPDAIEAYRLVEGIDPGGDWVSASLVQAGKSFEQLGRTREAAVCYGSLISRFADSSHAQIARRRLAAIDPSQSPNSPSIRR